MEQNITIEIPSEFVDSEDLVSKIHLIEYLESRWPYSQSGGKLFYDRIETSLKKIPVRFHNAAMALFANAIYLPKPWLDETWIYLLNEVSRKIDIEKKDLIEKSIIFELDPSGIQYDFINRNKIGGRLDIDHFPRVPTLDNLIENMLNVVSSTDTKFTKDQITDITFIYSKKFWIILVDNSLSGTSFCSEMEKAYKLKTLLESKFEPPKLISLIQVITKDANKKIEDTIKKNNIKLDDFILETGLFFNSNCKIEPQNKDCQLMREKTLQDVIELCRWFVTDESIGFNNDPRIIATRDLSGDDLSFGFKGGGWTIVTPNCPTNSVPLFWYESEKYKGPYIRINSRIGQKKGRGQDKMRLLLENKNEFIKNF